MYEIEAYNAPDITTTHYYLPSTTASVTGMRLNYPVIADPVNLGMNTPGGLIFLQYMGIPIQSADIIRIDGGANLNSAALNDGFYEMNLFGDWPFAPGLYMYYMNITASASPGTTHTLTYKAATRVVRVFPASTNSVSVAVFY